MPAPALPDLTALESELVRVTRLGIRLDCRRGDANTPSSLVTYALRSQLIRELLLGRHGEIDPRGIRISGAQILDNLDLSDISANIGLSLERCRMSGLKIERGNFPHLNLMGSSISFVQAAGVHLRGDLIMSDVQIVGSCEKGSVCLEGAVVEGAVLCDGLRVNNASGPALAGDDLKVARDMILHEARLTGSSHSGTVQLHDANVSGRLHFNGLYANNSIGPAIGAEGLHVGKGGSLRSAHLIGKGYPGTLDIENAKFDDEVDCYGMYIRNSSGPAVAADHLHVDGAMRFTRVKFSSTGTDAAIRMYDARINGRLEFWEALVNNTNGPSLWADRLQVNRGLQMSQARFSGSSNGEFLVRLLGARIDGQLNMSTADFRNPAGGTIQADTIDVSGSFILDKAKLIAGGAGESFSASGGRVGGQLSFNDARIESGDAGAVAMESMHVHDIFLRRVRIASGRTALMLANVRVDGSIHGEEMRLESRLWTTLNIEGIRVGGDVDFEDSRLMAKRRGRLISACGARIEGSLFLSGLELLGGSALKLDLEGADLGRKLLLSASVLCPEPWGRSCGYSRFMDLDSFRFGSLGMEWRDWLHLVRFHAISYMPSPYQHLATVERAAGHENNARIVLIDQQRDLHRLTRQELGGWAAWTFHRMWGLLAGYGYRVRRTALALFLALALAGALGFWAGHVTTAPGPVGTNPGYAAERTVASGTPGEPCSTVELIGLGLDRGLPLGPTGLRVRCDLDTTTPPGQLFTVMIWIVQAAVWGLATLALAGYTGLVRKAT